MGDQGSASSGGKGARPYFIAFLPVLIIIMALGGLWFYMSRYLNTGNMVSQGTQRLNEMDQKGVPQFSLEDLNGKQVRLEKFKDKVVLLNFWASWCDPCVKEFPSLIKLIQHFKGEVVLLAISGDTNRPDIDTFLKAFQVPQDPSIVILWDKDQVVAQSFGTQQLPESYLFSKGLILRRKVIGIEDWYSPNVISFFNDLVAGTLPQ